MTVFKCLLFELSKIFLTWCSGLISYWFCVHCCVIRKERIAPLAWQKNKVHPSLSQTSKVECFKIIVNRYGKALRLRCLRGYRIHLCETYPRKVLLNVGKNLIDWYLLGSSYQWNVKPITMSINKIWLGR